MKIEHADAVMLESVVRKACKCGRREIGGLVDADIYVGHPMEAYVLCVGWNYHKTHDEEIAAFGRKWRTIFDFPEENSEYTIDQFIHELNALVELIQ